MIQTIPFSSAPASLFVHMNSSLWLDWTIRFLLFKSYFYLSYSKRWTSSPVSNLTLNRYIYPSVFPPPLTPCSISFSFSVSSSLIRTNDTKEPSEFVYANILRVDDDEEELYEKEKQHSVGEGVNYISTYLHIPIHPSIHPNNYSPMYFDQPTYLLLFCFYSIHSSPL